MKKCILLIALLGCTASMSAQAHNHPATAAASSVSSSLTTTDRSGFYLGGRGGSVMSSDYPGGFDVGAQGGYRWNNGFRLEEALNYMSQGAKATHNESSIVTLMTNVYYDFYTNTFVTPYVGFGIGYANDTYSVRNRAGFVGHSRNVPRLPYQGIAGLNFQINRSLSIDVQDRLIRYPGKNVLEAGLNYYFST